jgi:predicted  nucleic acid-binding Zn-ribbon protein
MGLRQWLVGGIGVVVTVFGASIVAQSTSAQNPDVLSALLVEVRGLRAAMEQMASAGPRVQLALGRLQLQEQRLNTMIRRMESVRDSTADAARGVNQVQSELSRMQADIKAAEAIGDERVSRGLGYEMNLIKSKLQLAQQDLERWQAEEATLQQQIAGEQGRWSEINRALEDLERAMQKR